MPNLWAHEKENDVITWIGMLEELVETFGHVSVSLMPQPMGREAYR